VSESAIAVVWRFLADQAGFEWSPTLALLSNNHVSRPNSLESDQVLWRGCMRTVVGCGRRSRFAAKVWLTSTCSSLNGGMVASAKLAPCESADSARMLLLLPPTSVAGKRDLHAAILNADETRLPTSASKAEI